MNKVAKLIEMTGEVDTLLTTALNKIHGTEYSKRFWKILTGPYVTAIILNRKLLESTYLEIDPVIFLFSNTLTPNKKSIFFNRVRYFIKIIYSYRYLNSFKTKLKKYKSIASGFHDNELISSEAEIYLNTIYPYFKNKKIDHANRNIDIISNHKFSKTFMSNVIRLIPMVYIEYFDEMMERIPLFKPNIKEFHTSIIESVFMRFLLAKYVEHGAKLCYYQHGGSFGEYEYQTAHHYEGSIADEFRTWGWKIKDNDVPYKAFRLEKFKRNFTFRKRKSYDILMIYPILNKRNAESVKDDSKTFFNKIKRSNYPFICARPRPIARFRRKATLNFILKDVNKIDSGFSKIYNLVSKSKLVVILTYPSTTMLECLYIDHPAIALFNSNNFPSEIIKPYYSFFLEKGVFHHSMDSLVEHLNSTDIESWWCDLIKHPTYRRFKYQFLREV